MAARLENNKLLPVGFSKSGEAGKQLGPDDIATLTAALELALAIVRRLSPLSNAVPEVAKPVSLPMPISETITRDYIICLEDGCRVRSLKYYLRRFGLTPDQYRHKWGLPSDYPMVARSLSERRSEVARATRPHLSKTGRQKSTLS